MALSRWVGFGDGWSARLGGAQLVGSILVAGCLGPIPQAADDGPATGGSGGNGPTTSNGGGGAAQTGGMSAGGGGNTSSSGGGGNSSSSGGGGSGPGNLGGELHFLQSGAVELKNGSDTLTVSANGAFVFGQALTSGDSYHVTVTASPAGQTCWVQNGDGVSNGDVTNVDVRCTTVLHSATPSPGTQASTTSTTDVAIDDLPPLTFTTDIQADVLATLLLPSTTGSTGAVFFVSLELDGTPIARSAVQPYHNKIPAVAVAMKSVMPGNHTLTAKWSTVSGTLTLPSDLYRSEMSVTVLSSLASFDRMETQTLAANAGSTSIMSTQSTPVALGFTPITLDVSPASGQPAFLSLMANDLRGDRYLSRISVDGNGFLGASMAYEVGGMIVRSQTPAGVLNLPQGTHTIDAEWFREVNAFNSATRGSNNLPSTLSAALFKSGAQATSAVLEGSYALNTMPLSFTKLHSSLSTTLTLAKPSKLLVSFHSPNLREAPEWPASADVAIFVNGVQGPTLHPFNDDSIDWKSQGGLVIGVVDAPAGTVDVEVRVRQGADCAGNNSLEVGGLGVTGATRSVLSTIVLD